MQLSESKKEKNIHAVFVFAVLQLPGLYALFYVVLDVCVHLCEFQLLPLHLPPPAELMESLLHQLPGWEGKAPRNSCSSGSRIPWWNLLLSPLLLLGRQKGWGWEVKVGDSRGPD